MIPFVVKLNKQALFLQLTTGQIFMTGGAGVIYLRDVAKNGHIIRV